MRTFSISVIVLFAGMLFGWLFRDHFEMQTLEKPLEIFENASEPNESNAESIDPLYQVFSRSLANKDIDALTLSYLELSKARDNPLFHLAHSLILSEIQQSIDQTQFVFAESLTAILLNENHRDFPALLLRSVLKRRLKHFLVSLDILYEAKGYAPDIESVSRVTKAIRLTVGQYEETLTQSGKNYQLLALYDYLTRMEPEYSPYFIKLATTQLINGDRESARASLVLVSQDPYVGSQAHEMLKGLRSDEPLIVGGTEQIVDIPLIKYADHFLVEAVVNQSFSVELLIDTGATLTVLSPGMFSQLRTSNIRGGDIASFNTANGVVQASVYTIESLRIGGWQVNNLKVAVMALAGSQSVDGLLGMNFLQNFQFFIDQKSETLRLSD